MLTTDMICPGKKLDRKNPFSIEQAEEHLHVRKEPRLGFSCFIAIEFN
jgi:hypothetical protein